IVDRILIMPEARPWVADFVTDQTYSIHAWSWLELDRCRARPSVDRWLSSHCGADASEIKGLVDSVHVIPAVGSVCVPVALARMRLAPGVFVWDDVFCLGKIRRSEIHRGIQVVNVNENSVRRYVMSVPVMVVRCRTVEAAGERVDPGA